MDEKTAESAVKAFRTIYPEVPAFWERCELAAKETVFEGKAFIDERLVWRLEGDFLTIQLPSGRKLYYHHPKWEEVVPPWGYETAAKAQGWEESSLGFWVHTATDLWVDQITVPTWKALCQFKDIPPSTTWNLTYMGQDQYTRKWVRLTTHGGKLTENIVQAISRDVLVHGMLLYSSWGGNLVGHVHDEGIAEEEKSQAEEMLRKLILALALTPFWASGLKLAAHGYVAKRYRKD